ncbi:MAG: hypothetical protein MZV64_04730 [Ignavibacteriales bacterium]|nr:hypothetical protein [Ignavibacteriales bacterium]
MATGKICEQPRRCGPRVGDHADAVYRRGPSRCRPRSPGIFSGARATTRRRLNVKEQTTTEYPAEEVPVQHTHAL